MSEMLKLKMAIELKGTINTERGQQDYYYAAVAHQRLGTDPRFAWLCDADAYGKWLRFGVLAALGRIKDDDLLELVAADIVHRKPPTMEAVKLIRYYRLGRGPGDAVKEMADAVCKLVNGYLRCHPTVAHREAFMALENAVLEFVPVQRDVDEV
jgi:hypothetical protein